MQLDGAPNQPPTDEPWHHRLLRRLSRTTSRGNFIPEIDGLRSIAFLAVLLIHVHYFLEKLTPISLVTSWDRSLYTLVQMGFFGVPLFFSISGFIVSLPFASSILNSSPRVRLSDYFLRRVTRLEPPYLISLVFFAMLRLGIDRVPFSDLFPHLLASAFYVHNQIYQAYSTINAVAWSLEIEIQFYLLAPVILQLFRIQNTSLRRLFLIGFTIGLILLRPDTFRTKFSILGQFEYFAVGILVADVYLSEWKSCIPRRIWGDVLAACGFGGILLLLLTREARLRSMGLAAGLLILVLGCLSSKFCRKAIANPWVAAFGGMCYTFYLHHTWINSVVVRATKSLSTPSSYVSTFFLQSLLVFPFVVLICSAFFVAFEKPFMDRFWPSKLAARIRQRRF